MQYQLSRAIAGPFLRAVAWPTVIGAEHIPASGAAILASNHLSVVDSIYLYDKHGTPISHDTWGHLQRIVEWVCENWDQADEGIWETRGGRQQFTYSRLQSWVAGERTLRMAAARGLPSDRPRLEAARDRIYRQIHERG